MGGPACFKDGGYLLNCGHLRTRGEFSHKAVAPMADSDILGGWNKMENAPFSYEPSGTEKRCRQP